MNSVATNVNLAQCFKTIHNFGHDTVYNLCNHTSQVVPWGFMDWVLSSLLVGVIAILFIFIVGFIRFALSDF